VQRVCIIAKAIGEQLGGEGLALQAEQAALLAKADLLTDMVGEFPELQGIMGRYYALHDGLSADIADAIEDHYKPRFAGDTLPRNRVGTIVALADKLETLVGMFGIGQIPTGDRDPFALRRHALGVIRMLAENDLDLPLDALLQTASRRLPRSTASKRRNPRWPISSTTASPAACASRGTRRRKSMPWSASGRSAWATFPSAWPPSAPFAALPESAALAAANKRVGNILKKVGNAVEAVGRRRIAQGSAESRCTMPWSTSFPSADAAFATGDYMASRCRCWPPCARRSMPSSTASWSMPTIRPCAPTASACSPGCTAR
jgi:glycyl-tRNA synthetase beta chain